MPSPYPWERLDRYSTRDIETLRVLTRRSVGPRRPRQGADIDGIASAIAVRLGVPRSAAGHELHRILGALGTVVLSVARAGGPGAYLAVPADLLFAALRWLWPEVARELAAPRPVTWSERGLLALLAVTLLDDHGFVDVQVDVPTQPGRELAHGLSAGAPQLVPLQVQLAGSQHWVSLVLPADAAPTLDGLTVTAEPASLMSERGAWLATAPAQAAVMIGACSIARADLQCLQPRDVLVLADADRKRAALRVARGHVPVVINEHGRAVTVADNYTRSTTVNHSLFDDATVDISCRIGQVALTVRELLELQVGQVVSLATPVGGAVQVMCGDAVIARGQLVDVDGAVGVRILKLHEPSSRASAAAESDASGDVPPPRDAQP